MRHTPIKRFTRCLRILRGAQAETGVAAADTIAANLGLVATPFYRDFTPPIVLTMPDMHGSGKISSCLGLTRMSHKSHQVRCNGDQGCGSID